MEILDMKCAKYGSEIVSEIDNAAKERNKIETMITKTLGVLQEDGVYAFALYSKSKSGEGNTGINTEKKTAKLIYGKTFKLLKADKIGILPETCHDFLLGIRQSLAEGKDLDKLFLAKELLERTLVYARYHAKALDSNSNNGGV